MRRYEMTDCCGETITVELSPAVHENEEDTVLIDLDVSGTVEILVRDIPWLVLALNAMHMEYAK